MVNVINLRRRREVCTTTEESNSANCRNGKNLMQIVEEIVNKPSLTISKETIRREIVKFFKESEREGVETSSFKISLLDPFSRKRIRIPVRSIGCEHFQCFDLHNFLEFSVGNGSKEGGEEKSAWRCPHCQVEAKLEQLRIDGYFQEIVLKVGPEPLEVELFPDGQWKEVEQIDFKDVFPPDKDDDVVEIVPIKKARIQNETILENISAETTNPPPSDESTFTRRLSEILGMEKGEGASSSLSEEKILSIIQNLKENEAIVDRLRVILGLQQSGESEENQSGKVVENAVLALLNEKQKGGRCETETEEKVARDQAEAESPRAAVHLQQKQIHFLQEKLELESQLAEREQNLASKRRECKRLEQEIVHISVKIDSAEKVHKAAEKAANELENNIKETKQRIEEIKQQKADLEKKLVQESQKMLNLSPEQIEKYRSLKAELEKGTAIVSGKLGNVLEKQEFDKTIIEFDKNVLGACGERIKQKEIELEREQRNLNQLGENEQRQHELIEQEKQNLATLIEEVEDDKNRLDELEKNLQELNKEVSDADGKSFDIEKERAALQAQMHNLRRTGKQELDAEMKRNQIKQLQACQKFTKDEKEKIQGIIRRLKHALDIIQSERHAIMSRIQIVEMMMDDRQRVIDELSSQKDGIADKIFDAFCKEIGIKHISEYEEREMQTHEEKEGKLNTYNHAIQRQEYELEYMYSDNKQASLDQAAKKLKELKEQLTEAETRHQTELAVVENLERVVAQINAKVEKKREQLAAAGQSLNKN